MLVPLKPDAKSRQPLWLLRRNDQAILGTLAIAAIVALAFLWWQRGGFDGGLVAYDELHGQPIRFELDINTADWPEISELPRIGPVLAKRIVAHRQQHGPFQRLEDLRQVNGIGPKTFEAIFPYLMPLPKVGLELQSGEAR